ncbi:MAG TPA: MFS transporter [Sphingobium sp.]|uniref:MFS transporter n=1 Tax=Sphingobium sp. TaxID=1912891 RepID=UPI002ED0119C
MVSQSEAAQEWRQSWTLVLASCIGISFHTVMTASSGLFLQPLGDEFGWSRAQAASGISIAAVLSAILSPFFGILIDWWGTRKLALPGIILTGGIIVSFSLLTGSITQWIALWLTYAVISSLVKSTVWTAAVAGVFTAARGMALGLTLAGTALAMTVAPPLTNYLIQGFGWRDAYVWLGLGWSGVALVLCFFFLFDAHDRNREARVKAPAEEATRLAELPGLTVAQAIRDTALWRIGISTFVMMMLTIALQVHQFPLLVESGVSRDNAALLASLSGIAGIVGKIATGWFIDRLNPNWVGGLTLSLTAVAFVLLLDPFRTPLLIVVAMIVNGYSSGAKLQICGYLTSRYGGLRNFGKIFSVMASFIALGTGLGPVLGGLIYDSYGNYTPLLIAGIIGSFFSAWLIVGLRPYPDWSGETRAEPAPVPA